MPARVSELVPTSGQARDVFARAETVIEEARRLVHVDPFAGLTLAVKAQKAMKIYGRILAEAKAAHEIANRAAATRLKAERVAGDALQLIDRERGKVAGKGRDRSFRRGTSYQAALHENDIKPTTAHRWQTVASIPAPQFEAYIAERVETAKELTTSELLRAHLSVVNRATRVEKLNTIARGGRPLALPHRYPVLYVDPPWQYEHVKTESRAIENQYPTMTLEALCDLPIAAQTTDDAMLFLWATSPKLAEALRLLEAWTFLYRTSMVWVKDKLGMGYWARQQHELLLIATRGEPPTPAPGDRPSSVIHATTRAHSQKPDVVYTLIERMYPTLPKLELFARQLRPGWDRWGNQAGEGAAS